MVFCRGLEGWVDGLQSLPRGIKIYLKTELSRNIQRNVDMEIQAAERDMADAYEQYMDEQVDLQNQVSFRILLRTSHLV